MRTKSKITLLTLLIISPICAFSFFQKEIKLTEGLEIKKHLKAEKKHLYSINLKSGQALQAIIFQESIDVVIEVFSSDNTLIKKIDGYGDTENIDITSLKDDDYKLVIYPYEKDAKKGVYQLKVNNVYSIKENAKRMAKKEINSKKMFELLEQSLTDKNAIENFVKSNNNKHIIESIDGDKRNMLVTYFCTPDKNTEYVLQSGGPDFLGLRFHKLGKTKLHYASHQVPIDARFNYGFNYFKLLHAGPNKEVQYREMKHAYDGTVIMPKAPKQKYLIEKDNVKKGKLFTTSIKSKKLNEERKITIHTPANYNKNKIYKLLIVLDGEIYGGNQKGKTEVPTPTIMDNLISEDKIHPTITVFIWNKNGNRDKDLISPNFSTFIAEEVIPWTRSKYNISEKQNNIAIAGSSRGGYAASSIAFNNSNIIGNVISQSGSYWINDKKTGNHWLYPQNDGKLIKTFKESKKLPIKFYLEVGLYDNGVSMLGMNRQLRDVLQVKGYDIEYYEFKGGHSYLNWKETLSKGIISIFGKN